MANDKNKNLIPNKQRSHEELSAMGRKGGIASGKARRAKKERLKDLETAICRCTYDEVIDALIRKEKRIKQCYDESPTKPHL